MNKIYTMGIDIGSTSCKCVILSEGETVEATETVSLGAGTKGTEMVLEQTLNKAGLTQKDMAAIVATGYGRNSYEGADKTVSELSCHAKGGCYLFHGNVKTIIDIGGQDAKVLRLDDNCQLLNFVMNDKCAAGTGRFLEVMARVLDVKLEELGAMDAESTERAQISSTCTVFAESEVISSLAKNIDVKSIIRGIHYSVASRVAGQARRVGVADPVVMTGGVSRNRGVVRALEEELKTTIAVSEDSQIAGALGAAIFAYEHYIKQMKGERNE